MQPVFRALSKIEKTTARLQGKGYGAHSLHREVASIKKLLTQLPLSDEHKHNTTLVDVGANIGDYSAQLRSAFPLSRIFLFEPSPVNLQKLNNRFSHDNNIFIFPMALDNSSREACLYSDFPGSGLGSLTERELSFRNIDMKTKTKIQTVRFDQFFSNPSLEIDHFDFVKIDVEGHEIDVLNGMGDLLRKVRIIQFEFGGANIDTKTFFKDIYKLLISNYFTIYRISPIGLQNIYKYHEKEESFLTTNYVAVNQKSSF